MSKTKITYYIFLFFLSMALNSFAQYTESINSDNPHVRWKVTPLQDVSEDLSIVSKLNYNVQSWVNAVVPSTVFTSYVESGLEKDPNFGDNIHQVDRAKYDRSFVYRTEFDVPKSFTKEIVWLNFRGVNRKGNVFFNGKKLGSLNGFMERGKFDITSSLNANGKNVLVVVTHIPEHPLNNYGSPTYISSGGWDWMPYVPGLNSGITDKVFLSNTGALQLVDPWVRTDLPTNAKAEVQVLMNVKNSSKDYKEAHIKLTINPGNIVLTQKVGVQSGRISEAKFDKTYFSDLIINNPKLWWPNGYGEPNLYTCDIELEADGKLSERQTVQFGIKKYTYDQEGGVLHVSINGKRVFLKGGNWGMSEYMLRCRGDEYDTKIRFHKEMNLNMIRNWLGSTTDDEFYEACDKYGIMVWDDFWLNANPVLPEDIHVFNKNAIEKIVRVRNHPSVAVWCANNEGYPVPPLSNWLKENIATFDGGDRYYQPTSNYDGLSGSGMWGNFDPRWYFTDSPKSSTHGEIGWGLRTEIGTAVFVNYESFKEFMPEDKQWPRNEMWNTHYFGQNAFNALPDTYDAFIDQRYGKAEGIEDYCRKAQLLNIETNQAMYEGWLDNMWQDASGIITWMSQSAYPSMVWQTYDYYYDLTGAYWGLKRANEPLHIQWNPLSNSVKIANTTAKDYEGLQAEAKVYNMDGTEVTKFHQVAQLNSYSSTVSESFVIPFYKNLNNIGAHKPVTASSTDGGHAHEVADENPATRWASHGYDDQWIYIDLEKQENVFGVSLNFEKAYASKYKIQVSNDAQSWQDVSVINKGKEGVQEIFFDDVSARYVRMQGVKRASSWGYSLWDFKVYGGHEHNQDLSDVHFIRLTLKDNSGKLVSENTYWRGTNRTNFQALNNLPKVNLKTSSQLVEKDGKMYLNVKVTNPKSSPAIAYATWLQVHDSKTNKRILPAVYSDNYFILLKGETKEIEIEFDKTLLNDDSKLILTVEPYNNR